MAKKKTGVIFGASSGLGLALAELLHEEFDLILVSRSMGSIKLDFKAEQLNCDIRDSEEVYQTFLDIDQITKKIDLVIVTAAIGLVREFEDTIVGEIDNLIETDLLGSIYVAREAYRRMIKQKSGHIITVGSTSSLRPRKDEVIYCAAKWGIRGFTQSLRMAALEHGILVTGVYPGGMKSERFWQIEPKRNINKYMSPSKVARSIIDVIHSDPDTCPAELIIERRAA